MKATGQDLIKKILYLMISQLIGIIFCFHQTPTLKNSLKLSFKIFSLYFTLALYLPEINTREEHNINEHNIILIKILKLLKKDISDQLAILFN